MLINILINKHQIEFDIGVLKSTECAEIGLVLDIIQLIYSHFFVN